MLNLLPFFWRPQHGSIRRRAALQWLILTSALALAHLAAGQGQMQGDPVGYGTYGNPDNKTPPSGNSGSPKLASKRAYQAHGAMMWLSFGLLTPLAVIIARHGKGWGGELWLQLHVVLNIAGLLFSSIAFFLAVSEFHYWHSTHGQLGTAIMVVCFFQPVLGAVLRPKRGSARREAWFFAHWLLGTAVVVLGVYNIYTGLDHYYHLWFQSTRNVNIAFSLSLSVYAFLYLFLERREYMRQQGRPEEEDGPRKDSVELLQERLQARLERSNTAVSLAARQQQRGAGGGGGGGAAHFQRTDTFQSDVYSRASDAYAPSYGAGGGADHNPYPLGPERPRLDRVDTNASAYSYGYRHGGV